MSTLLECATQIGQVVGEHRGRGLSGRRPTQYHLDVAADEVALRVLVGAGYRVMSEESGLSGAGQITVVVDPIDGSTNCDRGVPFYATSLAALSGDELIAGVVVNLVTGTTYAAERGAGATRDGAPICTSAHTGIAGAIIGFSGTPARHLGWAQSRALGAASLEICLVADGSLDAYAVAQRSTLHPWDYLAGALIVRESGGRVGEYDGAELVTIEDVGRRFAAAASEGLLEELLVAGLV